MAGVEPAVTTKDAPIASSSKPTCTAGGDYPAIQNDALEEYRLDLPEGDVLYLPDVR